MQDPRSYEPMMAEPPSTERDLPRPGEVFAKRYELEDLLGRGGFGAVYRARDTQLAREVALKILHRGADEPVALARFLQEARAAAALSSENVAIVHEVGVAGEVPYLVMELLRGRDLQAELEARGRFPVASAIELVFQAMLGLAHAHAKHIVHRDLKPRNLFLAQRDDGTSTVKILDFGIAKTGASALTESGTALGTPQYMAPEQLRSARQVDARTDIWALGVVLYELTTGAAIFDAERSIELAAQIVVDPHVPLRARDPELPARLEAVIDRCLAKEPAGRYPDLGAFACALVEIGPKLAPLAARIERTLSARATTVRGKLDHKAGLSSDSDAAAVSTTPLPAVSTAERPASRRLFPIVVIAAIAFGLGGIAFVIAMATGSESGAHSFAAPHPEPGLVAIAAADGAPVESVPLSGPLDAAPPEPDASGAPEHEAAVVPSAKPHRPKPRRRAKPTQAEIDRLDGACQRSMVVPRFLIPNGGGYHVCTKLARLGCTALKRKCATEAIGDDDRQTCRDFFAVLREARACR